MCHQLPHGCVLRAQFFPAQGEGNCILPLVMRDQHVDVGGEEVDVLRVAGGNAVHDFARFLQFTDARQHLRLHQFQFAPVAVQGDGIAERLDRRRHLALFFRHQAKVVIKVGVFWKLLAQFLQQTEAGCAVRIFGEDAKNLRHILRAAIGFQQRRHMHQRFVGAAIGEQYAQQRQPGIIILGKGVQPDAGNLFSAGKIACVPSETIAVFQRVVLAALHGNISDSVECGAKLAGMVLKTGGHRAIKPGGRLRPLLLRLLLRGNGQRLTAEDGQRAEQGKRQTVTTWQF